VEGGADEERQGMGDREDYLERKCLIVVATMSVVVCMLV
jgi:hypothetical protein